MGARPNPPEAAPVVYAKDVASFLKVGGSAQVEIGPQRTKCLVDLLGWHPEHFIVVSMPDTSQIRSKDRVILRFVHKGQAVAFRTRVISGQKNPHPLLFLGFPERAEMVCLRNNPRATVSGKATLSLLGDDSGHVMLVDDLSTTGMGGVIASQEMVVQAGLAVMIKLDIQGMGEMPAIPAIIRSVRQDETSSTNRTRLGIEYMWTDTVEDQSKQQQIQDLVNRLVEI